VTIPVVDLARRTHRILPELLAAVDRVASSGRLLLGEELERFEYAWAEYVGFRYAVGVASGTDALTLALRAVGVGERSDDEVIVPAFTAIPTVAAVVAAGGRPVPVDVDALTAAMDLDAAAEAVTARTRAVVPVHLYGRPCPVPDLGVPVIEDAAQAHGALVGPPRGVAVAYSFYPTKNLGGIGDGGAVVTDDADLAARVRSLRNFARDTAGAYGEYALGSRMSEIESAALMAFLPLLRAETERRRAIAHRYHDAAPGLAWVADHADHVYHLCVLRERERLRAPLPFATAIHYRQAVTQVPAYAAFTRSPCPRAEMWARTSVTVPCFPELTDAEVEIVAGALAAAAGQA
jgi:dTDP-3-amino-3,4,6-trideoxy-alpha-D-glucose transaminase